MDSVHFGPTIRRTDIFVSFYVALANDNKAQYHLFHAHCHQHEQWPWGKPTTSNFS